MVALTYTADRDRDDHRVAAAVDRALALPDVQAYLSPNARAVVHVHEFTPGRPRSPATVECVTVVSDRGSGVVVRIGLDGSVRGCHAFASRTDSLIDPAGLEQALLDVLARTGEGLERVNGPWTRREIDDLVVHESRPSPNPSHEAATLLVHRSSGELLYAATTSHQGGRGIFP